MIEAFSWGLFGASSLVLGALLVALWMPSPKVLGAIMAFGAGVLLSAVSFELIEVAVETSGGTGGTIVGFFTGAVVFTVGDIAVSSLGYRDRKDIGAAPPQGGPTAIVLGALLDGVPESAVLGLTLLETGDIGVAMLVAVFVSNLPESIAATAGLRNAGWSQRAVLAMWSAIALVSALAAGAGFALLDTASPRTVAFILAFAGGAILAMLSTSMIPEGYEHAGRAAGLFTTLGFAVAFSIHLAES